MAFLALIVIIGLEGMPKSSQKGWLFLKIKHSLYSVSQKKVTFKISLRCLQMFFCCCLLLISPEAGSRGGRSADNQEKFQKYFFGTHWYRFFHSIFIIIIIRWRSQWSKSGATSPQTCRAPLPVLHSHKYLQTRISYKLKLGQEQYLLNKVF